MPLLSFPCATSTLFPIHTLLALATLPSFFSTSHLSRLILHILQAFVALPMLCPFLPLCFTAVQQPGILLFFRICGPPLHAVGFVILCKKSPALPSALLTIRFTLCSRMSSIFLLSSSSFIFPTNYTISLRCLFFFWMEPRFLAVCHQQLSNTPSVFSVQSPFRSVFHNLHSLLPLHLFFFFNGILMHDLPTLQVCTLRTKQSSPNFLILYFSLLRARLHPNGDPLPL